MAYSTNGWWLVQSTVAAVCLLDCSIACPATWINLGVKVSHSVQAVEGQILLRPDREHGMLLQPNHRFPDKHFQSGAGRTVTPLPRTTAIAAAFVPRQPWKARMTSAVSGSPRKAPRSARRLDAAGLKRDRGQCPRREQQARYMLYEVACVKVSITMLRRVL